MTQIALADKNSTPQVHGPFHITHADLGANWAAGFPLFTPAAGQYALAAWAVVTVAWVGDGLHCADDFVLDASIPVEIGSTGSNAAPGLSAAGHQVRAYSADGYSAGEADVYFLVAPIPA